MSSSSTQRVGRAPKDRGSKGQYSPQGTKPSPDGPKAQDGLNPKNQPTAEQMRIAQITYDVNKSDDPDLQRKIEQVMELTGKIADTVIIALHDCDNDPERAVDMLLEGDQNESEWETSGKKKKNRQPTPQKQSDGTTPSGTPNNKDKENRDRGEKQRDNKKEGGFRTRGPPRMSRGPGRNLHTSVGTTSGRNKENEKNEKNLEENKRERNPENRFRGARRGARGRGSGGRVRTFQNRGLSSSSTTSSFPQSIDTWTNSTVEQTDTGGHVEGNMPVGNWSEFTVTEDWSEEDWNESLTETKVFTPSTGIQPKIDVNENTRSHLSQSIDLAALLQTPDPPTTVQNSLQPNGILQSHHSSSVSQSSSQSQFSLSQYAQQAAETIKAAVGITSSMNSSSVPAYSSSVFPTQDNDQPSVQLPSDLQPSVNSHSTVQHVSSSSLSKTSPSLPPRNKTQKPRIPPPSKIPESAVEMPDDAIMALDVQFGALEFGADSTPFDFTNLSDPTTGYQESSLNSSTSHLNSQSTTGSHTGASNSSASMSNSLSSSLNKDSTYGLVSSSNHNSIAKEIPPSSVTNMATQAPKVNSGPESILLGQQPDRKNVGGTAYTNQRAASTTGIDSSYSSQKTSILGSGSNNYIHQNSTLESQSLLGSTSQNSYMGGSTQSHTLSASSAPYNMQQAAYVASSPTVTYPTQTAYTQQNTAYSYSAQQGYSGSNNSANHSASIASSKLGGSITHGVDTAQSVSQHSYEPNSSTGLTSTLAAATTGSTSVGLNSANMTGSSALGLPSTSSSTTTTSVLKNSLSASKTLPTMPPGVPAAMMSHQYIMGQAGLPFYGLQQPLYTSSYEEMQMLPSRLQPLGYYDMQFPAATSLTGRDPNLGSVAYTGDIKYSRADTDGSSVATTLSQGQAATQAHGQTFLNPAALPHGYGYYFHSGVMPGSLHPYGTPIFPVPAATNTHGASSSTQYQKTSFGSHNYCSGTGTAADLSNSIYSKAHTQLAKSFEKPGFHAGTPPPFNMAATQPTGSIGASSTPYGATPFIPVIAHGQHHSTMLHHHLQQDSSQQGTPSGGPQRNAQQSMGQQKGPTSSKQNFPYWNNN